MILLTISISMENFLLRGKFDAGYHFSGYGIISQILTKNFKKCPETSWKTSKMIEFNFDPDRVTLDM